MNCPVCNTFIEDENAKVCPCCNSNLKIAFQKKKVADAVLRNGEILDKAFKSSRFRTYAIIMSVICGLYALSVFYAIPSEGVMSAVLSYGLYLGFGIATLVGMWRLNSNKNSVPDKKDVTLLTYFPSLMHIMSNIMFVVMIVVCVFVFIALLVFTIDIRGGEGEMLNNIKAQISELEAQGIIVFDADFSKELLYNVFDILSRYAVLILIAVTVILAAGAVLYFFYARAFRSLKSYLGNLDTVLVTGIYAEPKIKFSRNLILAMGIVMIVVESPSIFFSGIFESLPSVLMGVYLIMSSMIFDEIHRDLSRNGEYVDEQRRILDDMLYEESCSSSEN